MSNVTLQACVQCGADTDQMLCEICLGEIEAQPVAPPVVAIAQESDHVPDLVLGQDQVALAHEELTDEELLDWFAKEHPRGVHLYGGNVGPVWLHPKMLLGMAHLDGFGLEMMGIVATAVELLRLACDPIKARELGGKGVDRLLKGFVGHAKYRSQSRGVNQLHGFRFGVSSKVCGADRVAPGKMEIHPTGNVAKRLARAFKCSIKTLEFRHCFVLRHPFILGYVCEIVFNDKLTNNLVQVNRLDFRKATRGDFDGDTANYFPITNVQLAWDLVDQIQEIVPDNDSSIATRGIASHERSIEMWGENIFEDGKSTAAKLNQRFVKTIDEWLLAHMKMGDYANKYTPFAYRISDICSLMAAVGAPGARLAGLLGAVLEEDFYLGLTGGPAMLDLAMEAWFKAKKMNVQVRRTILNGIRTVAAEGLVTGDVALALLEGARLNQFRIDEGSPVDVLTALGWLVGKGRITTDPRSIDLFKWASAIGDDPKLDPSYQGNFMALMGFHAAYTLGAVVGKGKAIAVDEDDPFAGLEDPFAASDEEGFEDYGW